jgi:formate dehydrogenase subunit gamma
MGPATLVHDIAALGMLVFFLAHVVVVLLPMSWPMLRSMFTGYITVEHAKAEHAGWYRRLVKPADMPSEPEEDRDAA